MTVNLLKSRLRDILSSLLDLDSTGYQLAQASHDTWKKIVEMYERNRGPINSFEQQTESNKGNSFGNLYLILTFIDEEFNKPNSRGIWLTTIQQWCSTDKAISEKLIEYPLIMNFVTKLAMFMHDSYATVRGKYDDVWSKTDELNRRKSFIVTAAIVNGVLEELNQRQSKPFVHVDKPYAITSETDIRALYGLSIVTDLEKKSLIRMWEHMLQFRQGVAPDRIRLAAKYMYEQYVQVMMDAHASISFPQKFEELVGEAMDGNLQSATAQFQLCIEHMVRPSFSAQELIQRLESTVRQVILEPGGRLSGSNELLESQAKIEHALWVIRTLRRQGMSAFTDTLKRRHQMRLYVDLPIDTRENGQFPTSVNMQMLDRMVVANTSLIYLIWFVEYYTAEIARFSGEIAIAPDIKKLVQQEKLIPENSAFQWDQ